MMRVAWRSLALLSLSVSVFAACTHVVADATTPTATIEPWFYGSWDAVSVDGVATPARIGATTYSDFALTSSASLSAITITQTNGPTAPGLVTCLIRVQTDATVNTLTTSYAAAMGGSCPPRYGAHVFVQVDDDDVMVTEWEGHIVVLVRH